MRLALGHDSLVWLFFRYLMEIVFVDSSINGTSSQYVNDWLLSIHVYILSESMSVDKMPSVNQFAMYHKIIFYDCYSMRH